MQAPAGLVKNNFMGQLNYAGAYGGTHVGTRGSCKKIILRTRVLMQVLVKK